MLFAVDTPIVAYSLYQGMLAGRSCFSFVKSTSFVALTVLLSAGTLLYAATLDMLPDGIDELTLAVVAAGAAVTAAVPCLLSRAFGHSH